MSALDVIKRVETCGGRLLVDADGLRVQAAAPLPDELVAAISKEKVAIMLALGAPFNVTITSALSELRPHLPRSLQRLPDDRLIVLINFAIMSAYDRAIMRFGPPARSTR